MYGRINQYFGLPDKLSPSKIAIVDSKESSSVKRKTQVYLLILKNKMKLISDSYMAAGLFLYGSTIEGLEQPLFPFGRACGVTDL